MHKATHIRHHPDIRWVVVVTVIITTALVLGLYTIGNLTKPVPALVLQNEQQQIYLHELSGAVKQLTAINQAMQEEIKNQNESIGVFRLELMTAKEELSKAQEMVSSTKAELNTQMLKAKIKS
ncbi:MAG: hypothetical protein A2821_00170 [Candidatus Magasanikbacteria bacterium RIFCSPHIGHO2_01_FULL_41_23]|uniref:Uncharacterized protein n=1 Tax=Candidatus Magasanikbacteria bacterium RIFCSPLOWO2_01_FULL_40_15 TaxID=1798686 RepID=A0A1F6N4A7_9BACT|nr:MAG: hypothetical protein A2821_00170 [Candidatus Magasanikbacteria bacterium RIFCSPHIGHO2_01_FULL_41_23]OGH76590.1 MAG: hypothetical protein A3F22_04600 [Candidatus Magasanikbacteria bacterium RIFCSPHIGHO2_12_FULL_41_16]OGH78568.1 MAG: hypothetical protein A2983_02800 [Candidatus Magasanikbacteria bacterium RIFCSPLOWO2_01_FULL_40_15]